MSLVPSWIASSSLERTARWMRPLALAATAATAFGCSSTKTPEPPPPPACSAANNCTELASGASEQSVQDAFATVKAGGTIKFGAGTFKLSAGMAIAANNVTVTGAGIDQTILDFSGQASGNEGIFAQSVENLKLEGFTVQDTKGNGIKVLSSTGVTFHNVKAQWTKGTPTSHGGYGLYPVQSKNVLIDGCVASGASDSGIYVGQSQNVVVRNSEAFGNVAGIEIENTFFADVYNNNAHDNTGGILVFDLPELQQLGGHSVRVYNNQIHDNNTANFAPQGNVVGNVPAGTGFFVMANSDIEIFGNTFTNNKTAQSAVISYLILQIAIKDPNYYPYPSKVYFHDNTFVNGGTAPDTATLLGLVLGSAKSKFPNGVISEVLYDGITDSAKGTGTNPMQICVKQPGSHFVNLHFDKSADISSVLEVDPAGYDCTLPPLPAVSFPGL